MTHHSDYGDYELFTYDYPDPYMDAQARAATVSARGPSDWSMTIEPSEDGPEGVVLVVTDPEGQQYRCPRDWSAMRRYAATPEADIEYVFSDGDAFHAKETA